jgi:hypothetical protein
MTRASIERMLWLVAIAGASAAWAGTHAASLSEVHPRPADLSAPAPPRRTDEGALAAAERRIGDGDPFRLERRPPSVAFARQVAGMAPGDASGGFVPPPMPKFRPPLVLTGVVGPPWQGIVEGIPNQQGGVVVRQGERYGDLRIRSVGPDAVVVQGPDTTWRLTLKPRWQ